MKYGIQPVLKEVAEFIERNNWGDYESEDFQDMAYQIDKVHLNGAEAVCILQKLYRINSGKE